MDRTLPVALGCFMSLGFYAFVLHATPFEFISCSLPLDSPVMTPVGLPVFDR